MILQCTCEQAHQDEIYGKGKRLHRQENGAWICTVCAAEKYLNLKAPEKAPLTPETPKPSPSTKKK